jgi:hypothetical protein
VSWIKIILEGLRAASHLAKAATGKRGKPGVDVQPITPDDLKKKP